MHLCRIGKSTTTEAVIVGVYRPNIPVTGRTASANKFFIGHTLDWTANPITWVAIRYSPPGISTRNTGYYEDGWMDYGLAVRWKNTVLELFQNQEVICTLSLSKTGYDEVFFMTPVQAEHRIGCVRWLKSVNDIDPIRFLTINGVDEYYP